MGFGWAGGSREGVPNLAAFSGSLSDMPLVAWAASTPCMHSAGRLSLAFPLPALPLCPQAAMVLVFMFSASWRLTVVTFGELGDAQLGRRAACACAWQNLLRCAGC